MGADRRYNSGKLIHMNRWPTTRCSCRSFATSARYWRCVEDWGRWGGRSNFESSPNPVIGLDEGLASLGVTLLSMKWTEERDTLGAKKTILPPNFSGFCLTACPSSIMHTFTLSHIEGQRSCFPILRQFVLT